MHYHCALEKRRKNGAKPWKNEENRNINRLDFSRMEVGVWVSVVTGSSPVRPTNNKTRWFQRVLRFI